MSTTVRIRVKKLQEEAIIPTYAHEGDACADLYTISTALIQPGEIVKLSTGLAFEIPKGWRVDVRPRSGLSCKMQLFIPNSPGTIDAPYRGDVSVYLKNLSKVPVQIREGDRIAQIKPEKVHVFEFEEVDDLSDSDRRGGGFGSTGR